MINLDEKTQKLYEKELIQFDGFLLNIKSNYLQSKNKFLTENFIGVNRFRVECHNTFIIQFIDFLGLLVFYENDKDVITKLIDLGFSNNLHKYITNIESIEKEIKRLELIEGLLIFPNSYLIACYNYLTTKFIIEALDKFIGCDYNGIETNKLFVDFKNRNRRRNYEKYDNPKPFKNEFEYLMNMQLDLLEKKAIEFELEKSNFTNLNLKILNGKSSFLQKSFQFETIGLSNRQVYKELFPLFKLVLKDKEFKSMFEFDKNDYALNYNYDYDLYKISKVRDILNLK